DVKNIKKILSNKILLIKDNNSQRNRYYIDIESRNSSKSESSSIKTIITNENLTKRENSKDLNETKTY
ncbi:hypothetical protein HN51_040248, partial [Arachis hypogaea]